MDNKQNLSCKRCGKVIEKDSSKKLCSECSRKDIITDAAIGAFIAMGGISYYFMLKIPITFPLAFVLSCLCGLITAFIFLNLLLFLSK